VLGVTLYLGFRFANVRKQIENYFYLKVISSWALGIIVNTHQQRYISWLPAQGFTGNWILLVQGLMVPIVLLGAIWFIVPLYRSYWLKYIRIF
jgi:SSS family solute:Na+ symporter